LLQVLLPTACASRRRRDVVVSDASYRARARKIVIDRSLVMGRRRIGICLAVAALLPACASRGPGLQGPEAENLFRSFSGTWDLDEGSSGDPPILAQPPLRRPSDDAAGGDDDGGGGGGRAGGTTAGRGGAGGARRDPPGGRNDGLPPRGRFGRPIDTGAIFAASELARTRPASIELALTDSLFLARYEAGVTTRVPMNGTEVQIEVNSRPARAWVEWREGRPRLTWVIEDGGHITDRFEVLPTGRLALSRLYNSGFGGDVEVRFVYSRRDGAGQ
jgi:hypothetical protein